MECTQGPQRCRVQSNHCADTGGGGALAGGAGDDAAACDARALRGELSQQPGKQLAQEPREAQGPPQGPPQERGAQQGRQLAREPQALQEHVVAQRRAELAPPVLEATEERCTHRTLTGRQVVEALRLLQRHEEER